MHWITVEVFDEEARRDAGYGVATERRVSLSLSNGQHLRGTVRVYRPAGRDRLSDWSRHGPRFRYLETTYSTFLVNVDHIASVKRGLKDQAEIALRDHPETLIVSRAFTHLFKQM